MNTTTTMEDTKKLHAVRYKDMYRVQYGISKKMGHSVYPWANTASTMYGGGRTVATIKPVRTKATAYAKAKTRHWTVCMVGQKVHGQTFNSKASALLFVATELEL